MDRGEIPVDAAAPGVPQGDIPSINDLLASLNSLDLPETEKEKLKKLFEGGSQLDVDDMKEYLKPSLEILPTENRLMVGTVIIALVIVLTLFVFFGYKLYKSLVDKQRKQQEKKLKKEMKKRR